MKPKLRNIPFGILEFFGAAILEFFLLPIGIFWELVLGAPVIEEILKYLANRSRTLKGGIGSGLGFSIIENASYFISLSGSPFLVLTVIIRSLSDVMLHSFNSGLSSFSYQRRGKMRFGLPAAMLIHATFNLVIFEIQYIFILLEFFLTVFFIMILSVVIRLDRGEPGLTIELITRMKHLYISK